MAYFQSNGARLHYEVHGQGEPVVLVNGILMTTRTWAPQVEDLASRFQCVLYDLRGQLLSDKPGHDYSFEEHAEDLLALLDTLGLASAHIVATSYGGAVSMCFAARHPERVRSLSLIATVAEGDEAHRRRFQEWLDVMQPDPAALYLHCVPQFYSKRFRTVRADHIERLDAWVRERDPSYFLGLRRLIPAIRDVNLAPRLASIECPTLVVRAGSDALLGSQTSPRIGAGIAGAELVEIEGAGHAITVEQPAAINRLVSRFIRRQGGTMSKLSKTDQEWRAELTPEQYRITRQKGTEPPFSGQYYHNKEHGLYRCVACGTPLFSSETKYDSGSGWPSFYAPVAEENVETETDTSHGMRRVEVLCRHCEAHLGHIFEDGPAPTGLRYCINSAALSFDKAKE